MTVRNRLLSVLSAEDRALIDPHLGFVELPLRTIVQPCDAEPESVYFLESGLASLIAVAGPERIEVGVIGREGMTGVPAILGAGEGRHEGIMQLAGTAYRMAVPDLGRCMAASPTFAGVLLRFVHVTLVQISQTALANGRRTVEQRLARWLLMAHDRIDGDEIALTHEFLAVMLGVRRPGVTVALHVLEGEHAIKSRRNSITISDRDTLRAVAGPAYGTTEALYETLFGPAREA